MVGDTESSCTSTSQLSCKATIRVAERDPETTVAAKTLSNPSSGWNKKTLVLGPLYWSSCENIVFWADLVGAAQNSVEVWALRERLECNAVKIRHVLDLRQNNKAKKLVCSKNKHFIPIKSRSVYLNSHSEGFTIRCQVAVSNSLHTMC